MDLIVNVAAFISILVVIFSVFIVCLIEKKSYGQKSRQNLMKATRGRDRLKAKTYIKNKIKEEKGAT